MNGLNKITELPGKLGRILCPSLIHSEIKHEITKTFEVGKSRRGWPEIIKEVRTFCESLGERAQ